MALTVSEVLALEVFDRAGVEVLAGRRSLGAEVRWAHISDLPDVAAFLKGGELLVTTGLGMAGDQRQQRQYLHGLADAGVACVVVELGGAVDEVPECIVEEAAARSLPLVSLRHETPFVEITEQVHTAIISQQYALLRKAEKIGHDFSDLLASGAGPGRIVHALATIARNPVVLEDAAHQVAEFAVHGQPINGVLAEWDSHARVEHDAVPAAVNGEYAPRRPVCVETVGCLCMPVRLRGDTWGRLHLLEKDKELDEIDFLALDRAAAALGLALLVDHDASFLSDHARGALISDILRGRFGSAEEVFDRARALGADLRGKRLVVVALELRDVDERRLSERDRQQLRLAVLTECRAAFAETGVAALPALQSERTVAILGLPIGVEARSFVNQLGERIADKVQAQADVKVVVGASGEVGPETLRRGFDEAREAARFGLHANRADTAFHFDDLGIHQLLFRLTDGPDLARFVEAELRPLLEHDAKKQVPLLPSLRTYLETSGSKSQTARMLHIERRSLYHRLERISKILRRNLDDVEVRTRLLVAIWGLDLLRNRTSAIGDGAADARR